MNIGAAALQSGVSVKMIRYYEEIGMTPPMPRSPAGYRHYNDADVHRLRFIYRARNLGFSIKNIRSLLALWDDRTRPNEDVRKVATEHITTLRTRINELETIVNTLQTLVEECAHHDRPDCPILSTLEQL